MRAFPKKRKQPVIIESTDPREKTYTSTRVKRMPTGADKGKQLEYKLKGARRQKKKWPQPDDAKLILNLHFSVKSFKQHTFHADATLEIPVKEGFQYFSVTNTNKTKAGALRHVIEEIQNSFWFQHMKKRGVYFRVTGIEMEDIYRGYL